MKKIVSVFLLCMLLFSAVSCADTAADGVDTDTSAGSGTGAVCTLTILCDTLYAHPEMCDAALYAILPENGVILDTVEIPISDGTTVFDVLSEACRSGNIHMEHSTSPVYNTVYIEGIANVYEFDGGPLSGWMYSVNGEYPNFGASFYRLQDGDEIVIRYTLELGEDIGGDYAAQISQTGDEQ